MIHKMLRIADPYRPALLMTYKKQDRLFLLVTLVIEVPIGNFNGY